MNEEITNAPFIDEKINYTQEAELTNGNIEIHFNNFPIDTTRDLITTIIAICESAKNNKKPASEIVQKIPKIKKPKLEKPPGKMPETPRGSSWEYKFIRESNNLDDVLKDYWRKFPKTKLQKENVIDLWKYDHTVAWDKLQSEKPEPRTETDPEPGKQIGMNSKVIQIKGNSPAVGIGTVTQIKKDGTCKVQFFNHIKVLPIDHFALATQNDINKARGIP